MRKNAREEKGGGQLPIRLEAVSNTYVVVACALAVGVTGILWMTAVAQGQTVSLQSLAFAPGAVGFMVLYLKNAAVRLDETGISKGLPCLRTFIPYQMIDRVTKVVLLRRGSPPAAVISERDSKRRIVIPLYSLDRTEVSRMVAVLGRLAPQAQVDEDLTYTQVHTSTFGGT